MLTSGTENNVGFGVIPLPDTVWICGDTLRDVTPFVSIRVRDLLFVLCLAIGVSAVSNALPESLYFLLRNFGKNNVLLWSTITAPLVSFTLHQLMHIYRVVIETITPDQALTGTLSIMPVYSGTKYRGGGKAPVYSIVEWDYRQRMDNRNEANQADEVGLQNLGEGSVETALPSPDHTPRRSDSNETDVDNLASDDAELETPQSERDDSIQGEGESNGGTDDEEIGGPRLVATIRAESIMTVMNLNEVE